MPPIVDGIEDRADAVGQLDDVAVRPGVRDTAVWLERQPHASGSLTNSVPRAREVAAQPCFFRAKRSFSSLFEPEALAFQIQALTREAERFRGFVVVAFRVRQRPLDRRPLELIGGLLQRLFEANRYFRLLD